MKTEVTHVKWRSQKVPIVIIYRIQNEHKIFIASGEAICVRNDEDLYLLGTNNSFSKHLLSP